MSLSNLQAEVEMAMPGDSLSISHSLKEGVTEGYT